MTQQCFTWDTADFTFDNNIYTWDDVCFVLSISGGTDDLSAWDEQKRKKFISVYIKVKAQQEPGYLYDWRIPEKSKSIEPKNIRITAEDVKLVIENVLNVTVEI
jgi:hypothetical protein